MLKNLQARVGMTAYMANSKEAMDCSGTTVALPLHCLRRFSEI